MINMSVLDYRIRSDERQLILYKVRRDEEGQIKLNKNNDESTTFIGYYNTLEQVLKGIIKHHTFTSETEINTLDEYRQELREIVKEFNEKIKLGE